MWRLGCTSYVVAGDFMTNLRAVAGIADDMELVLWHTPDGMNNFPSPRETAEMAQFAADHAMTFTVHLPFDLDAQPDTARLNQQVLVLTKPLHPFAVVFHITAQDAGSAAWYDHACAQLDALVRQVDNPRVLALENLERYAPELLQPLFDQFPVSRTLDIGHLWKRGLDAFAYCDAWLPHSRVVHLHGMMDTDHQSLTVVPSDMLRRVLDRLRGWDGVLTLEVFEDDFFTSREALRKVTP